jgi:hypothetical protein
MELGILGGGGGGIGRMFWEFGNWSLLGRGLFRGSAIVFCEEPTRVVCDDVGVAWADPAGEVP